MDTVRKTTNSGEVRGAAGFPVVTILVSFSLILAGWGLGNAITAVIGLLGLLGSVVGMEFIMSGSQEHTYHRSTSGSKVMHT